MTTPNIREWFDDEGENYDWKSDDIELVRNNLKRISDSGTYPNRTQHFWKRDSLVRDYINKSKNLSDWIERQNKAYLESVSENIRKAESKSELQGIDIDDDYSTDIVNELTAERILRNYTLEILSTEKRDFGIDARARIESVTTVSELRSLGAELYDRGIELGIRSPRQVYGTYLDRKAEELMS